MLNKILKILFVISLVLLVITLNVKLFLFNFNVYQKEFSRLNIYEIFPNADKNALNLINYINNKEELNDFYNEKEKSHLQDVKNLFNLNNIIFYLTLILIIIFLIYFIYIKDYKSIYLSLFISSLILVLFMILFFVIDFNSLFIKFHEIAFNNNNWLLDPSIDNLIVLFPVELQYNIGIRMLINILISTVALIMMAIALRRFVLSKSFLNNKIQKNVR